MTDEAKMYEELYMQLSNELQLVQGMSDVEERHAAVGAAWALFIDVVDTKGFRDRLGKGDRPLPKHQPVCEVVLQKEATQRSFGFGIHNVPEVQDCQHVLFVDKVILDGTLDIANLKMRKQGTPENIVQPFGVITAVNDVDDSQEAMIQELVSSELVKLRVVNPRKVEEAVAIVDYLRGLGSFRESPGFWHDETGKDAVPASYSDPGKDAFPELRQVEKQDTGDPETRRGVFTGLFECGCSNFVREAKSKKKS